MRISLIVAVAENGVIGVSGAMPWKLSSDLRYFKAKTLNKPVLMGRKTFESIGGPLPGRDNIIITRNPDFSHEGISTVANVALGLEVAEKMAEERGAEEIMVIGGGEIYAQTLTFADRIYKTEVQMNVVGDTIFPQLDPERWQEVSRIQHQAGENDNADYAFVILERC